MTEQQLKDLLADMSLEEKIGQMVQLTANFYGTDMLITGPMGSAKIEPEDMKLCGTILGTKWCSKVKGRFRTMQWPRSHITFNAVYA